MDNPYLRALSKALEWTDSFWQNNKKKVSFFAVVFLIVFFVYRNTIVAPANFPEERIITLREGAGLIELGESLKRDGVIRSPLLFRMTAILGGGERVMKAGDYYLPDRLNVFRMTYRIIRGDHQLETIRITIPEGFTKTQITDLFDDRFPMFDKEWFLTEAKEGFLFPDTYFVGVNITASSTLSLLTNNFDKKVSSLSEEIKNSQLTFDEIITLASILEAEADTLEDREIVAGIILERIRIRMPLQVDATLKYATGRGSVDLTQDDLKSDSPYNSYVNIGLPPTPISNPGLESIKAALNPKKTPYLYFLTGKDGKMYYARNFEEHKRNREKYLD